MDEEDVREPRRVTWPMVALAVISCVYVLTFLDVAHAIRSDLVRALYCLLGIVLLGALLAVTRHLVED
jgi:hypothetical protein